MMRSRGEREGALLGSTSSKHPLRVLRILVHEDVL